MLGHEPAPLAILDCVEFGLMQPIDGAIRAEMSMFAHLIQRPEPRNMIRTMFLGKQAYDKASREGTLSPAVIVASEAIARLVVSAMPENLDLTTALQSLAPEIGQMAAKLSPVEMLQLDHAVTLSSAIPAYVGGASGVLELAAA
ncbi:hypothetical protein, partial [Novosphingobium sp.]|uniref:hypothetical protein n=1 Tax=Novosphingobium sp. TaxID=1874826 RepID=UPI0026259081